MTGFTADAQALARQIRTELSDDAPQGFRFQEQALKQDDALERMASRLKADTDPQQLSEAISSALASESDGWVVLKLLELVERLELAACADALMTVAENPPGAGDRRMFLAGRACEVLLRLPLDRARRLKADEACKVPLEQVAAFRHGAERERALHRPRRVEWALLAGMMALALLGLWLTFRSP